MGARRDRSRPLLAPSPAACVVTLAGLPLAVACEGEVTPGWTRFARSSMSSWERSGLFGERVGARAATGENCAFCHLFSLALEPFYDQAASLILPQDRNLLPTQKPKKSHFSDHDVCKHYLCGNEGCCGFQLKHRLIAQASAPVSCLQTQGATWVSAPFRLLRSRAHAGVLPGTCTKLHEDAMRDMWEKEPNKDKYHYER